MYVIWYIMLLDAYNLFGNLLIDKGTIRTFKGTIITGHDF